MKHFSLLFYFTLFLVSSCGDQQEKSYVLLISFDGFRSDYLDWYDTPHMDRFVKEGVRAE